MHILVVEDNDILRDVIDISLKESGYTCELFESSEEAIAKIPSIVESVDVLISDYQMPDRDGMDVAQAAWKFRPDLPVIMISGLASPLETEWMLKEGVSAFLTKPFHASDLIKVLQNLSVHPHTPDK